MWHRERDEKGRFVRRAPEQGASSRPVRSQRRRSEASAGTSGLAELARNQEPPAHSHTSERTGEVSGHDKNEVLNMN